MKRIATLVILGFAALLGACASTGGTQQLTPQQIVAIACPPIQMAVTQFQTLAATMPADPNYAKAGDILKQAQAPLAAACTAGATVTVANIQDLATKVLPAVGTVMTTIPIPPQTQAEVQAGLMAAEIAVGAAGVIEQQLAAAKAAQAAAPASAAVTTQ
jgi:hypothetical protein